MSYFTGLIGQDSIKRQLGFYIDTFKETRTIPFLGFFSPKGYGKTVFAQRTMDHLTQEDGSERRCETINCSAIRNNESFFQDIVMRIIGSRQVNILFDEAHNLANDVTQALLTICNVSKDPIRNFEFGDSTFTFNFKRIAFLFATTEPDKLFDPLKDRLQSIEFRPYTREDIGKMVDMYCPDILFQDGVREGVIDSIRDNPRSVVKRADEINRYAFGIGHTPYFGKTAWAALEHTLGINPLGLENTEMTVLGVLHKRGACSLQTLANVCGMSRSALQRSVENRLIKCGLVEIDVKRRLTDKGRKFAAELEKGGKLPEIF